MRARAISSATFAIAALMLILPGCKASEPKLPPPERIFLFVVDTLRRDHVSAYGRRASTPNMDALAARGVRIDNAVASYHQTTMSMAALFTGRTPALESGDSSKNLAWTGRSWCGLSRFSNDKDKACVPRSMTTLAERLSEAGYWTAGVTSNRMLFHPYGYRQGFERWEEVGVRRPRRGGRGARRARQTGRSHQVDARFVNTRALKVLAERPNDRFFLYVHWLDVHEYSRSYANQVEKFDAQFGRFVDKVEEQGLLENAWIILTSDHGESLGELTAVGRRRQHKGNPSFEAELRVPLITVPRIFPEEHGLIRSQDVPRLLLSALGLKGLAPHNPLEDDELFVSELLYQTYRRGRFKSMHPRDAGPTLLFDLDSKKSETVNIAANHPEIVAEHQKRIEELTQELRTEVPVRKRLTAEDIERLQALGYMDE